MRKGYEISDRHGRKRDEDDDAPLRDGETLRVPMFMMDSSNSTPLQRAIAKHSHEITDKISSDARRRKVVERDPQGRLKATYEEEEEEQKDAAMIANDATYITDATGAPYVLADALGRTDRYSLARDNGFRRLIPVGNHADGTATVQQARRDMIDAMSNAWRGDAARPGAYPYRAAAEGTPCTINGRPGTLVREGDYLVCKPSARQDAHPTFDAVEGARRKQEAYDAMIKEMSEAWRGGK